MVLQSKCHPCKRGLRTTSEYSFPEKSDRSKNKLNRQTDNSFINQSGQSEMMKIGVTQMLTNQDRQRQGKVWGEVDEFADQLWEASEILCRTVSLTGEAETRQRTERRSCSGGLRCCIYNWKGFGSGYRTYLVSTLQPFVWASGRKLSGVAEFFYSFLFCSYWSTTKHSELHHDISIKKFGIFSKCFEELENEVWMHDLEYI